MTEALTTALKLGHWALARTLDTAAIGGKITITRGYLHNLQHILRIRLPVSRHVQHTANFKLLPHQFGELGFNDAPLAVPGLVPRDGEVHQYSIKAGISATTRVQIGMN